MITHNERNKNKIRIKKDEKQTRRENERKLINKVKKHFFTTHIGK